VYSDTRNDLVDGALGPAGSEGTDGNLPLALRRLGEEVDIVSVWTRRGSTVNVDV
jgi:hypothetical protein